MPRIQTLILVAIAYAAATAAAALTLLYSQTEYVLLKTLYADIAATVIIFIFSLMFNNSSFYDPYWSIAPIPILIYWIHISGNLSTAAVLLFGGMLLWSVRLTWNWTHLWRGLEHEDWRYRDFRKKFGKLYWPISFLGIHLFPTLIVYLCLIPAYMALFHRQASFNALDIIAFTICITGTYLEFLADKQMEEFKAVNKGKNICMDKKLWSVSRHPNYLGENLIWISMFLFAAAADMAHFRYIACPIAMLLLFLLYSIPAMEAKILKTRPQYQDIMKRIPPLFPSLFPPGSHQDVSKVRSEK